MSYRGTAGPTGLATNHPRSRCRGRQSGAEAEIPRSTNSVPTLTVDRRAAFAATSPCDGSFDAEAAARAVGYYTSLNRQVLDGDVVDAVRATRRASSIDTTRRRTASSRSSTNSSVASSSGDAGRRSTRSCPRPSPAPPSTGYTTTPTTAPPRATPATESGSLRPPPATGVTPLTQ